MITKEKFEAYEKVRMSGKTNMFYTQMVCKLAKYIIDSDDCLDIMRNYTKYKEMFR